MKKVIWKFYVNYEKEEAWLNKLSQQGLALQDFFWCRYLFADAQPGAYTYRIELLENGPSHPESQKYLAFLEENGIECVASHFRWVYLRKKAADGSFDLYSDIDSRIRHYQRVYSMQLIIGLCNLAIGLPRLIEYAVAMLRSLPAPLGTPFPLGSINTALGILLLCIALPFVFKVRRLKKEKQIHE